MSEIERAARRLVAAWRWADEHPEDPHAGDQIDYVRDLLESLIPMEES